MESYGKEKVGIVKKILMKLSVLLPIIMVVKLTVSPFELYFQATATVVSRMTAVCITVFFTLLHLCCSPCRKICCNGNWCELFYNLMPICLVGLVIFAQWHLAIALVFLLLSIGINVWWFVCLKQENKQEKSEKKRAANKRLVIRIQCVTVTAICLVPSIISLFAYGLRSPFYIPATDLSYSSTAMYNNGKPSYSSASELWAEFQEDKWEKYDTQKRTDLLQKLSDFEAARLNCPAVPLSVLNISLFVNGIFLPEENRIEISIKHVMTSPIYEVIHTTIEEAFHAYEQYIITNVDWNSEIARSAYFEEAWLWKENRDNYISGAGGDSMNEYKEQPLEASAKAYADKETEAILSYIR